MKVAVIGLGYVGAVTSACLAKLGHHVVGVDRMAGKVERINAGEAPITEPGLDDLIAEMRATGRLEATQRLDAAVGATELAVVCVGTPTGADGSPDMAAMDIVVGDIGSALSANGRPYVVALRSTSLPGTSERYRALLRERVGRDDVDVCSHPEFLREGSAISDFESPAFIVVGTDDEHTAAVVRELYAPFVASSPDLFHVMAPAAAEMLKYACNAYHAVKVAFANEIGALAATLGLDSHAVMGAFVKDTKLNTSRAYLRPGFAFGGSCLPKDLRALAFLAGRSDLRLPLLESAIPSNQRHLARTLDRVLSLSPKRVAVWGISFKSDTADVRESPVVDLLHGILAAGVPAQWHDPDVAGALTRRGGSDSVAYLEERIPHALDLHVPNAAELAVVADLHVVSKFDQSFAEVLRAAKAPVLDLNGSYRDAISADRYVGLLW